PLLEQPSRRRAGVKHDVYRVCRLRQGHLADAACPTGDRVEGSGRKAIERHVAREDAIHRQRAVGLIDRRQTLQPGSLLEVVDTWRAVRNMNRVQLARLT